MSHAPTTTREEFQTFLECGMADRRRLAALLDALDDCDDTLPGIYCDLMELPRGSTYAEAVEIVRANNRMRR